MHPTVKLNGYNAARNLLYAVTCLLCKPISLGYYSQMPSKIWSESITCTELCCTRSKVKMVMSWYGDNGVLWTPWFDVSDIKLPLTKSIGDQWVISWQCIHVWASQCKTNDKSLIQSLPHISSYQDKRGQYTIRAKETNWLSRENKLTCYQGKGTNWISGQKRLIGYQDKKEQCTIRTQITNWLSVQKRPTGSQDKKD